MKSVSKKMLAVFLAFTLVMPMLIVGMPGALAGDACESGDDCTCAASPPGDDGSDSTLEEGDTGSLGGDGDEDDPDPDPDECKCPRNEDDPKFVFICYCNDDAKKKDDDGADSAGKDSSAGSSGSTGGGSKSAPPADGSSAGVDGDLPNESNDPASGSSDTNQSGGAKTGGNKNPAIDPGVGGVPGIPGLGGIGITPLSPGFGGDSDDSEKPGAGFMLEFILPQSELLDPDSIDPLAELLDMGSVIANPTNLDLGTATVIPYNPDDHIGTIYLTNNTSSDVNGTILLSGSFHTSGKTSVYMPQTSPSDYVTVRPITGLLDGVYTATITISYTGGGGVSGSFSIPITFTVNTTVVDEVTLDRTSLTLTPGSSRQLTATVLPVEAPNKTVTWSQVSSSGDIFVDNNGLVSVSAGAQAGETAIIRAASNADPTKFADCVVSVISYTPVPAPTPNPDPGPAPKPNPLDDTDKSEIHSLPIKDYELPLRIKPEKPGFADINKTSTGKTANFVDGKITGKNGEVIGKLIKGGGFSIEDDEFIWDENTLPQENAELNPGDGLVFSIGDKKDRGKVIDFEENRYKLDKYTLDLANALGWKKDGPILRFEDSGNKIPVLVTLGYMMNGGFVPEEDGLQVPDDATIAIGFLTPNFFVSTETVEGSLPVFKRWSMNDGPGEIEWVPFTLKNEEVLLSGGDVNVHFTKGTVFITGNCSGFTGTVEVNPGASFTIRREPDEGDKMFGGTLPLSEDTVSGIMAQRGQIFTLHGAYEWFGLYLKIAPAEDGDATDPFEKVSIDINSLRTKDVVMIDPGESMQGEEAVISSDIGKMTKTKFTPVVGEGIKHVFTPDIFASFDYRIEYDPMSNISEYDPMSNISVDSTNLEDRDTHTVLLLVGFQLG